MTKVKKQSEKFGSFWDAVSDTPEEAENMKVRSALMAQINQYIARKGYTQAQVAEICQITQPRASELVNGKLSKFSLDALVNIAAAAKLQVNITGNEVEFA